MPIFGFWNVDSARNFESDEQDLPRLVSNFALERSIEVLFLVECSMPYDFLMSAFKDGPEYYPVECGDRFKVLARFDQKLMSRLLPPVPSDRFEIWHLTLPLQEDVILVLVHGLDKRNNSPAKQELFLTQVTSALSYFERLLGHDRSIVVGDFNSNPFESPIASTGGMNAVMSRVIAQTGSRVLYEQSYPYFYNPMWNLYGDKHRRSAPATYYYRSSDPHELYWHMLDQVLIRPSLLHAFDLNTLEIVTAVRDMPLISPRGVPDRKRFSDHLPVVFALDLFTRSAEGDKRVQESLAKL